MSTLHSERPERPGSMSLSVICQSITLFLEEIFKDDVQQLRELAILFRLQEAAMKFEFWLHDILDNMEVQVLDDLKHFQVKGDLRCHLEKGLQSSQRISEVLVSSEPLRSRRESASHQLMAFQRAVNDLLDLADTVDLELRSNDVEKEQNSRLVSISSKNLHEAQAASDMDITGYGSSFESVYESLNQDTKDIRILRILDRRSDGMLRVSLEIVSLDDRPEYDTISYCWGDPQHQGTIEINGVLMNVPVSAISALQGIRPRAERSFQHVWIDAICINQYDVKERSAQVRMMRDIFRQSRLLLVWLGDDNEIIRRAEPSMSLVINALREQKAHGISMEPTTTDLRSYEMETEAFKELARAGFEFETVGELLALPWFSRLWTAQEAIQSTDIRMLCGDTEFPWSDIVDVYSWLQHNNMPMLLRRHQSTVVFFQSWALLHEYREGSDNRDALRQMLYMAKSLKCSDPRDKIYGLLGLAGWRKASSHADELSLTVDYHLTTAEVYSRAAEYLIGKFNSLDVLAHVEHGDGGPQISDALGLPSWVPRFDQGPPDDFNLSLSLNFNACGGQELEYICSRRTSGILTLDLKGLRLARAAAAIPRIQSVESLSLSTLAAFSTQYHSFVAQYGLDAEEFTQLVRRVTKEARRSTTAYHSIVDERAYIKANLEEFMHSAEHGSAAIAPSDKGALSPQILEFALQAATQLPGKTVFMTEQMSVGIGPSSLRAGDFVVILAGGNSPFVLRAVGDDTYKLVGACYVDKIMEGEVLAESQHRWRRFHLV